MSANPDYPVNNQFKNQQDIMRRQHDNTNDAQRVNLVAGDISVTVGAVEIKDGGSNLRADVVATPNGNALLVSTQGTSQSKVVVYGDSSVASNATAVLATYTVPSGKKFSFSGGLVGGDEAGEFSFEIQTIRNGLWRNSGAVRSALITFPVSPDASAGAVVEIKVKNIGDKTKQFEATLFGFNTTV